MGFQKVWQPRNKLDNGGVFQSRLTLQDSALLRCIDDIYNLNMGVSWTATGDFKEICMPKQKTNNREK